MSGLKLSNLLEGFLHILVYEVCTTQIFVSKLSLTSFYVCIIALLDRSFQLKSYNNLVPTEFPKIFTIFKYIYK